MTQEQHRQAVDALAAMIGDWLRKRAVTQGGQDAE
jgi:hypothetical protein